MTAEELDAERLRNRAYTLEGLRQINGTRGNDPLTETELLRIMRLVAVFDAARSVGGDAVAQAVVVAFAVSEGKP